jgi:hypothetical protein
MFFSKSLDDKLKELIRWGKEVKLNIPSKIEDVQKIAKLDVSSKGIAKLPKYLNLFSNLTELNLSYNLLKTLPTEIKDLKKLKVLDLGYNAFTEMPEFVYQLDQLRVLNFEANNLKKISSSIGNLQELTDLNLFANQITELPQEIGNLKKLIKLNLAVNQLKNLPSTFEGLTNIEVLELWLNKFDLIPKVISSLPKLTDLYNSFDTEKLNKALIKAIFANNYMLTEKLIFYGADVNYKLEGFGSQLFTTPLFEAKSLGMVKLLLSKGANPYLKREIIKIVMTKEGGEQIRSTGKFETFLTRKNPPEIEKYLKTATLPPEPADDPEKTSESSDIFF